MSLAAKMALARAAGVLSRRSGRGATSLPGRVLMRLEPDAIARLASRLPEGSAVISATNGKTTTAAMAAGVLRGSGHSLVHNRAGANMAGGVASTLLAAARRGGRMDGQLGLFEVDEFWLDQVIEAIRPRALLLGNLFRDQLDRFGELEAIADRWAAVIASVPAQRMAVALNADDPLIADLGRQRSGVMYFGIEDDRLARPALSHASDSKHCRRCGAPYRYEAIYLGHLGRYECPSCGARRPVCQVVARDVTLDGVRGSRFTLEAAGAVAQVELGLPGLYNVYNALAAAALALTLEPDLFRVAALLGETQPAFGRSESVTVDGCELKILLVKNPAGANEVLRTLALEPGEHHVLGVLNDNTADGRDVSWIWDADFEELAPCIRRATCSGTRAPELALRLRYAGVAAERIVVEDQLPHALDGALRGACADGKPLFALPTYTAMLALRDELRGRGQLTEAWA